MSEEMLVKHCSPTLAGMKTGSMFVCRYDSVNEMRNSVRQWNRTLASKGLRVLPLRFNEKSALIYIYRPTKLKQDLTDETACHILRERGYITETPERCIVRLIKRMAEYEVFPMKSVCFLGIPRRMCVGLLKTKPVTVNAADAGRSTAMRKQHKRPLQNTKNVLRFTVLSTQTESLSNGSQ